LSHKYLILAASSEHAVAHFAHDSGDTVVLVREVTHSAVQCSAVNHIVLLLAAYSLL
jgi:hypothetical protein